ncbi:MAG: hypothetical protein ACRCT8_09805 [Lacipirellulaceae bacterium]
MLTLPEDILAEVAAGELPKSLIRSIQAVKGDNPEAEMRRLIGEYKASGAHTAVVAKAQAKRQKEPPVRGVKKTTTIGDGRGKKAA